MGRLPLIDEDVTAGRLAIAVDRPVPVSSGYWLVKPPGIETRREIVAFRNWLLKEMSQLNWNRQIFDIIKESCILAMLPAILPTTIFRIWRQKSQAPWQLGRCSVLEGQWESGRRVVPLSQVGPYFCDHIIGQRPTSTASASRKNTVSACASAALQGCI
ncbi:MAG: hypothetical protein WCD69_01635 [Xanthobacteraceae bacterium]